MKNNLMRKFNKEILRFNFVSNCKCPAIFVLLIFLMQCTQFVANAKVHETPFIVGKRIITDADIEKRANLISVLKNGGIIDSALIKQDFSHAILTTIANESAIQQLLGAKRKRSGETYKLSEKLNETLSPRLKDDLMSAMNSQILLADAVSSKLSSEKNRTNKIFSKAKTLLSKASSRSYTILIAHSVMPQSSMLDIGLIIDFTDEVKELLKTGCKSAQSSSFIKCTTMKNTQWDQLSDAIATTLLLAILSDKNSFVARDSVTGSVFGVKILSRKNLDNLQGLNDEKVNNIAQAAALYKHSEKIKSEIMLSARGLYADVSNVSIVNFATNQP